MPGLNYRMTEFQAALGLTQLKKLDRILAARRRCATIYNSLLESIPIQPPKLLQGNVHVYQSYVVLLPESSGANRDIIIQNLRDRGIEATIGTWHMPLTSHFRSRYGYKKGYFPFAERTFVRSISLPMYEYLSEQEQIKVVKYLGDILAELGDRP
jgi:dTDP-4-amino-4,6-dideoxygalactose transaminase